MLVTSALALLGIGAVAAVILAVASRLLRVEENPLIEEVADALPGANCGGCGFAGCEAYAAAVVVNPDIPANLCTVGGNEVADKVGTLSGKAVVTGEPTVSFRRCSRAEGNVKIKYEYVGTATCASAALLEGGPYMCTWACLGYGDCLRACPFDAMYLENGMVEIIPSKCVSCGQCVKACPRSILQIIPRRARVANHCATREKLKSVSDVCGVGCINCLKCLKACPADAITYDHRRIEIDYSLCIAYGQACGEACVASCPRGILRYRGPMPLRPEAPAVDRSETADIDEQAFAGAEPAPAPETSDEAQAAAARAAALDAAAQAAEVPRAAPSAAAPAPSPASAEALVGAKPSMTSQPVDMSFVKEESNS